MRIRLPLVASDLRVVVGGLEEPHLVRSLASWHSGWVGRRGKKSRGSDVGEYPHVQGDPSLCTPKARASPQRSPSCLPGAQAQHSPWHSCLISRSGSTDPPLPPEPTSGSTSDPVPLHAIPLFLPGTCTGYLPSAWSPGLLFSGLHNCPAPQMMAALTISVPKALVNFTCLEKVSVTINRNVFFFLYPPLVNSGA